MERQKKSKYNMWQNTAYMLDVAWHSYKSVIFLVLVLAVATAGRAAAELLLAPVILGKVEAGAPFSELVQTILCFTLILFGFSGVKTYVNENVCFGRVGTRMELVRRVLKKSAQTAYPNLLNTEFKKHLNKAMEICDGNGQAAENIWTTWTDILTDLMGFAIYLFLLKGLHPMLFVVVIVTAFLSYRINKRVNDWNYGKEEEEMGLILKLIYLKNTAASAGYAKDIRVFGLRNWLEDIWSRTLRLYYDFQGKKGRRYLGADIADILFTLLRNGIAYGYLIWLVLSKGLPASQFLLYFGAVSGFAVWITGILEKFGQLHKESLEISSLRECLEWEEPFLYEQGEPLLPEPSASYELCLENVSYRYPGAKKDTIQNLSFTLQPGEKVAVVGLNGAGKTTLIKLLCGFLEPTEGRVLLNGVDIRKYNRHDYYALFSAVFQDFSVLDTSIAENVSQSVKDIDRELVWDCLRKAGLEEKVKALPEKLDTHIGHEVFEDGVELSGGEMQRLMLARALYKNAPVLVLDEPTAALDPIAENDIYQKYAGMTKGRSSVFISHRLASTRFCDRILYMEKGTIREEGTHEELLELGGGYAGLFEIQSRYYQEEKQEGGFTYARA